jgi:hypothetical protein
MGRRLQLQETLETILGSRNVYFQPPPNIKMSYPCIVYKLDNEQIDYAENSRYLANERYTVTLIHSDPDTYLREELAKIQWASFDRAYATNNLNHFSFTIYI